MLKFVYFLAFFAVFSLALASNIKRRAVYNMMKGHGIKDHYQVAASNVYSAKDEVNTVFKLLEPSTRPAMRIGNEVTELDEWIISGSPEFYQSIKPESVKTNGLLYASKMSNLRHSMRNKVESKHQKLHMGAEELTAKPYVTGSARASFATPAPAYSL